MALYERKLFGRNYTENYEQLTKALNKKKGFFSRMIEKRSFSSYVRNTMVTAQYLCANKIMAADGKFDLKVLRNKTGRILFQLYIMREDEKGDGAVLKDLNFLDCLNLIWHVRDYSVSKYDLEFISDCSPNSFVRSKILSIFNERRLIRENYGLRILIDMITEFTRKIQFYPQFKNFIQDVNNEADIIRKLIIFMAKNEHKGVWCGLCSMYHR